MRSRRSIWDEWDDLTLAEKLGRISGGEKLWRLITFLLFTAVVAMALLHLKSQRENALRFARLEKSATATRDGLAQVMKEQQALRARDVSIAAKKAGVEKKTLAKRHKAKSKEPFVARR